MHFLILPRSLATYCRWDGNRRTDSEFPYEATVKRILKMGPHLRKLLSNIKGIVLYWRTLYMYISNIMLLTFNWN